MSKDPVKETDTRKKGGKILSALCCICGVLILAAVILSAAALTVPRFLGWQSFNIVSGSMEPGIPVGSLVYSISISPEEVQEGDIIVFRTGGSYTAHRVIRNNSVEGKFTTKGDANAEEDMSPVYYDNLIGIVKAHIPYAGNLLVLYGSLTGKIYVLLAAASGAMFLILSGRLSNRS